MAVWKYNICVLIIPDTSILPLMEVLVKNGSVNPPT